MRPDYHKSIEEVVIDQIASDLRLFSRQQNAYKFLCPYCQTGSSDRKGKPYAKGNAKGYLYQIGKTWNFKCHKSNCSTHTQKSGGKSFEKFLADHFPKQHLEYVRRRDELGLTGYQTNCPALETVLKGKGILGKKAPDSGSGNHKSGNASPGSTKNNVHPPVAPKITPLPPVRSPQQQAGYQSRLNYQVKQRQQQRQREIGDFWLG